MTGTIKAIKRDKGFGFIRAEDGQDRFFHANHVVGVTLQDLQEGDKVEFEPYEFALPDGKVGLRGREVKRA